MFVSRKLNQDLQVQKAKPAIVSQQCIVYQFKCNLCDAQYVDYTRGHLHERVDDHKRNLRPLSTNTTRMDTMAWFLRTKLISFACPPNAKTNLTALLKRCFLYVG